MLAKMQNYKQSCHLYECRIMHYSLLITAELEIVKINKKPHISLTVINMYKPIPLSKLPLYLQYTGSIIQLYYDMSDKTDQNLSCLLQGICHKSLWYFVFLTIHLRTDMQHSNPSSAGTIYTWDPNPVIANVSVLSCLLLPGFALSGFLIIFNITLFLQKDEYQFHISHVCNICRGHCLN